MLVAQKSTVGVFGSTHQESGLQVIDIEADRALISQWSQTNLDSGVTDQNLAYIIYTSGTTGRPKGVLSQHFNVTRLFSQTEQWFQFCDRDVWTLFHSYAFDFSVWEIWGALLYGGRLVVVPYAISRWPKAFCQLLRAEQVTVLNQTPSAFRQLMRAEENVKEVEPLALRYVIFGGEALDLQSLKPWFEQYGDSEPQLVNMYGITETTVHVTYRPLTLADLNSAGSMIGQPIPDLQLYILDSQQQQVAIGETGELYVGGAGLARGYLNRPELTAEKFIPNPFGPSSFDESSVNQSTTEKYERLLYRTGDLACYQPNGDIQYLGRIDHQVKIRGFRIELGEIESLLGQQPDISEAVVVVREDTADDQRLVAYVVPRASAAQSQALTHRLREALKAKLPDYMVPATYVMVEALPLTVNGKVDRRSLPAPQAGQKAVSTEFVPPRTPTEKKLSEVWCQTLNLDKVGVFDSFFELGGHSLLATQVVSWAEATYQRQLSLSDFFKSPTISAQANLLDQKNADTTQRWSSLVPLGLSAEQSVKADQRPALFCVHGGGGSVLMYQPLARHLQDCVSVYGLQSSYLNNPDLLLDTVEAMAVLYIKELQEVQPSGPYLIGGYCAGSLIALEMAQRLQAAGETVALLALFDPMPVQTVSQQKRGWGHKVQSLLTRIEQHGIGIVARDSWLKVCMWIYQRLGRSLPLAMRIVKAQAANVRAAQTYAAKSGYAAPVAIYAPERGLHTQGEMPDSWKTVLAEQVQLRTVCGSHHFDESTKGSFFAEPAVRTLAEQLEADIAAAVKPSLLVPLSAVSEEALV